MYRGCSNPTELDARQTEIEALAFGRGGPRSGLAAPGAGARGRPLPLAQRHGTNTVNDLVRNAGAWNLVLNAQGRIQGDLTVWREGDDTLELEIAADQYGEAAGAISNASSSWTMWS